MGTIVWKTQGECKTPSFDPNVVAAPTSTPGQKVALVGYKAKHTAGPDNIKNQLISLEVAIDEAGMYAIRFIAFPEGTLTGGAWVDVNSWTTIQKNTGITSVPIGGTEIYATVLASTNQTSSTGVTDMEKLQLRANAGDEFLLIKEEIISGNGSGTVFLGLSWVDC